MTDQLPYCIHCGAQQLNADAKFCHRCGRPILPAASTRPGRGKAAPWLAPVLVSAVIVVVAAIVFARLLSEGPAASETAGATPIPPIAVGAAAPAKAAQSPAVRVTPPMAVATPRQETTTPSPPAATDTPQPTPTLAGITPGPVRLTRLAWSPDGRLLAVGSATGAYLYDTGTWQEMRFVPVNVSVPSSLEDGVDELAFSFDGTLVAVLARAVQVWRVADGGLAYEVKAGGLLAASPAEGLWATFGETGGTSGNLRLWRAGDGQLMRTIATDLGWPAAVAFSSDGRLIAAGPMIPGSPGVWQTADGQRISRLTWGLVDYYSWDGLAFQPNTSVIAAAGFLAPEPVLLLWDANTGAVTRQLIAPHEMPEGPAVNGVSFAPDGKLLAAGFWGERGQQSKVQLWSADGSRGRSWMLAGQPNDLGFSPDSRGLAVIVGQSIYLFNVADGSVVRQVEPVWHQGLLPTPTPTPVVLDLDLPADWKEYFSNPKDPASRFRLGIPPTWFLRFRGDQHIELSKANPLDDLTTMVVEIYLMMYCDPDMQIAGSPASVDRIKERHLRLSSPPGEISVFVEGGKWPFYISASYGEFDTTHDAYASGYRGYDLPSALAHRETREIELYMWGQSSDYCVEATLEDELEDISEQDRLDLSRVLASIQLEDVQHPFPTVTPTIIRNPTLAPRPAEPLQFSFDARTYRDGDQGAADVTVEVRDAHGQPVTGVWPIMHSSTSPSRTRFLGDGRSTTTIYSYDSTDRTVTVEVQWNGQVIAKQEFVVSWQ